MKIKFGPGVDRKVTFTTDQLNQAAISQGMAYHEKHFYGGTAPWLGSSHHTPAIRRAKIKAARKARLRNQRLARR